MEAKYQGLKIEILEILENPITQSGGVENPEDNDHVIEDVWD